MNTEDMMTFTAEEIALAESRVNMMPFEQIVKSLMFGRYLKVNECISGLEAHVQQLRDALMEAELDCRGYDALHGWLEKAATALAATKTTYPEPPSHS